MKSKPQTLGKYRRCVNKGCRRKAIDAVVPEPYEAFDLRGKHITLFGWTLYLYKNEKQYQTDICYQCSLDAQNEPIHRAIAESNGEFYL